MRSKLKVAIVAPSLRILGGQSVQADALLRAWSGDPEVDAWLVPHNPEPPGAVRHALKVKYARTIATELTYLPQLVRELARADVVHIFSASYTSFLLAPLPAAVIARRLGRPAVLNYHSGEAPDHLRRSGIARHALKRMDRVVVPSPFLRQVFSRFDIDATVIPNIIDLDRFRFAERNPLRARLLSTRNLADPYNVACTLRAFHEVQKRRPDATLTVVGRGPHEGALRSLASALHLNAVRFTGAIDPADIHQAYADHDIYLQSPDIDNMPLSVLEAFACGLPVVSTDVGGVPTMLRHGEHGLLAPAGDHHALAAHVLTLLDAPPLARRIALAARDLVQSCGWSSVRDQWLAVYRRAAVPGGALTTRPIRAATPARPHHTVGIGDR
jgi:glycosyltransferase involved in cell wall biosynthesis